MEISASTAHGAISGYAIVPVAEINLMGNESSVGDGSSLLKNVQLRSAGRRWGSGLDDDEGFSQSNSGELKTFRDEYMLQSRIGEARGRDFRGGASKRTYYMVDTKYLVGDKYTRT